MKKKLIIIFIGLASSYLLYIAAIAFYGYFRHVEYHEAPATPPVVVISSEKIAKKNEMKLSEALSRIQETQAFQNIELKEVEQRNSAGNTPLHIAVCLGDLEVVSTLIKEGADINALGEFEETALHFAAGEWHLEVIEYLIANGAVARPNVHGDWPSTLAGNHTEITGLLKSIEP